MLFIPAAEIPKVPVPRLATRWVVVQRAIAQKRISFLRLFPLISRPPTSSHFRRRSARRWRGFSSFNSSKPHLFTMAQRRGRAVATTTTALLVCGSYPPPTSVAPQTHLRNPLALSTLEQTTEPLGRQPRGKRKIEKRRKRIKMTASPTLDGLPTELDWTENKGNIGTTEKRSQWKRYARLCSLRLRHQEH